VNILVCNNFVRHGGGVDASVGIEVQALRQKGHRVRVFGADNAALDHSVGLERARLLASCLYSLPAKRALLQVLSEDRYEIAHVHNTVPLLTGSIYDALRTHPIVVIQHLHNFRAFCLNAYAYRDEKPCDLCVQTAFAACASHRCYRDSFVASAALTAARLVDCAHGRMRGDHAHAYIANSDFTKMKHVQHGLADSLVWVVHSASEDISAVLAGGATPPLARRRRLTFVGSLIREKGVYCVLDLAEAMPDWEVQLIGTGLEGAALRRQVRVRRLHNVRLAGELDGTAKAQAWHDSFVTLAPSLSAETFGLVIPESYSLAIPVVSTGSGGMAEIIRDGATGFLQSFRDPSATAELLRALWEDKVRYAAMCREARRLFESEFTLQLLADRLATAQAEIREACGEAAVAGSRVRRPWSRRHV
jgi:glycosyltransferase involved in cell wall biosynthesis